MASQARRGPNLYRGASVEDRRARRREQLIEAAISVYGQRGYRNTTVKAVCEAAGLTERYFYESFANSEALLIASYNRVTSDLIAELKVAGALAGADRELRARLMMEAYFAALRREPASARVFLAEIRGVSAAVDQQIAESLLLFGRLTIEAWEVDGSRIDQMFMAGIVGSGMHIALAWIAADYDRPVEDVARVALRISSLMRFEG